MSFSLSSNSNGELSCYDAGKHRPYSYIRMYFSTSTNPPSWFNYLTGFDSGSGSAAIGNGSWYVVLMMTCLLSHLYFVLLIELSFHLRLSFSLSLNSNGVGSCREAGKH